MTQLYTKCVVVYGNIPSPTTAGNLPPLPKLYVLMINDVPQLVLHEQHAAAFVIMLRSLVGEGNACSAIWWGRGMLAVLFGGGGACLQYYFKVAIKVITTVLIYLCP